jgi:Peptidase family M23
MIPFLLFEKAEGMSRIGLSGVDIHRLKKRLVTALAPTILLSASLCSAQPGAVLLTSPQLILPVKCKVGESCLVQKLVDHDPGPGRQDYRCGMLTTDGHDGVDIRLRTLRDMEAGYDVVAAAGGTVLRTRDDEPDVSSLVRTDRDGKDAGNGVVVDHGNGWETQYSHLKSGSIAVRPGQKIIAGERLGYIGMSGNSEFPHLHFSVRHKGRPIDPFTSVAMPGQCSRAAPLSGMWAPSVARALGYVPTAAVTVGFASEVPPRSVAERKGAPQTAGRQAPLLLWVDIIGAKDGDMQEFSIAGPGGDSVHSQLVRVANGGLSWFAYSGKRAPPSGWLTGRYTGRYVLKRDGQTIINAETFWDLH